MSGYTDHALMNEDVTAGAAFLQKPFTPEVFARRVRQHPRRGTGCIG